MGEKMKLSFIAIKFEFNSCIHKAMCFKTCIYNSITFARKISYAINQLNTSIVNIINSYAILKYNFMYFYNYTLKTYLIQKSIIFKLRI